MSLANHICEGGIALRGRAACWEDAVRGAGNLLCCAGICDEDYVEDMVRTVKELGPYIVVTPGVALAHARPEGRVRRNGVAVLTLSTPVEFGNAANDPVSVVFAIAAVTDDEHLLLFQEVAQFLEEEANLLSLRNARKACELPLMLSEIATVA